MRARSANSAVSSGQIGRIPEYIFVGFAGQRAFSFKSHEKDFLKTSEKECNVLAVLWTLYYGSVLATEVTESTEKLKNINQCKSVVKNKLATKTLRHKEVKNSNFVSLGRQSYGASETWRLCGKKFERAGYGKKNLNLVCCVC